MNRRDFIRSLLLVPATVALWKVKPKEAVAYGTLEQIVEIEEETDHTDAMLIESEDSPSTLYVSGEGGKLIVTHDWGVTWEEVTA